MSNGESPASMALFSLVVAAWTIFASLLVGYSVIMTADITEQQVTTLSILGGPALLIINQLLAERKERVSASLEMHRSEQSHRHVCEQHGMRGEEE